MAAPARPSRRTRRRQRSRSEAARFFGDLRHELAENRLALYSSAIAYRALVSLIPLILLGLGLLGAFGLQSTWRNSLAPAIDPRLERPLARGLNAVVERILSSGTGGLIAFATVLVLWDITLAVSTVMDALNRIHHVEEGRPFWQRSAVAVALAATTTICLIGSILIMTTAPLVNGGRLHWLFGIGRWLVVPLVLALGIALLFRFAPAEHPQTAWASVGSVLVIVVWLVASLAFREWIAVADYKTATGSLTVFLTLSLYVFVTASIFLVGAQVDELLRRRTDGDAREAWRELRRLVSS